MANYQIIDARNVNDNTSDWINFLANHFNYSNEYINTLNNCELAHVSNSECVLKCVDRLKKAKDNNEAVIIFGDYDCDGVCSTSIMDELLTYLDIKHGYYIPNRFTEGYGLNNERILQAYQKGYKLLITVDNGIVAYQQIEYALSLGMDVIISDHHTIDKKLDVLTVHPDYMEPVFTGLCGGGVAFEIARHFFINDKIAVLAMVATIGDMMNLENENRFIVKYGLNILNSNGYYPINCLCDNKEVIDEKDIGFSIVSKINSIGRLQQYNPNNLVTYFRQNDKNMINNIALQINQANQLRKDGVKNISDSIICDSSNAIVVAVSDNLSLGLLGLVAANLCKQYNKPAFVFSKVNDTVSCSARSVEGINIYNFIKNLNYDKLISFGGHKAALGLSLSASNLDEFISLIKDKSTQIEIEEIKEIIFSIDISQLTDNLYQALDILKPYDKTHIKPLFVLNNYHVISSILLKDKYPKITLDNNINVLSFKHTDFNQVISNKWIIEINDNYFHGKCYKQLLINELLSI